MAQKTEILFAGFFDSTLIFAGKNRSEAHRIEHYQIEFITQDGGVTFIDGQRIPLCRNTVLCARPGAERYSFFPFRCYYIHLLASEETAVFLNTLPTSFQSEHVEGFARTVGEMTRLADSNAPDKKIREYGLLYTLLADMGAECRRQKEIEKAPSREAHRAIGRALAYIDAHYQSPCPLDTLAAVAGFSPVYFLRLFRRVTGKTPGEYLCHRRVGEAKRRLAAGKEPLSSIALASGFSSQSYFNDVFRRTEGMTPTEYRREKAAGYL